MKKSFLFILLSFYCLVIIAQEKKGNELYDNLGYLSAAQEFQNLKAEELTTEIKQKIANSYRLNSQFEPAEYWYAQIVQEATDPKIILHYAQMLQSNGKCEDAIRWYKTYQEKTNDSHRSFIEDCAEMESFEQHPNMRLKNETALNSDKHDFSPIPFRNGLLFTSMRKPSKSSLSNIDQWTDSNFSDLYFTEKKGDNFGEATPLKGDINGTYHDGVACYDPIQKALLFTRNTLKGKSEEGIRHLKIFAATEKDGEWVETKELSFSDNEYSSCHPTLSADGQRLYFSSNRPEGFGGMDIYVSKRTGNDWGTPSNLGPIVNSSGNEVFPFVSENGKLFFASDGHKGIGGLDVFVVEKSSDEDELSWVNRKNIGMPFNSEHDDFGFYIDATEESGFISSNRKGGMGADEIYSWKKIEDNPTDPFDPKPTPKAAEGPGTNLGTQTATLFVCDEATKATISGAKVGILKVASSWLAYEPNTDLPHSILKTAPSGGYTVQIANGVLKADASLTSNYQGAFQYFYEPQETYALFAEAESYAANYQQYTGWDIAQLADKCIYLEKNNCFSLQGQVINQRFKNPIKGATIELLNLCTGEKMDFITGEDGYFNYCLNCNCEYEITASKASFTTVKTAVSTVNLDCANPTTIQKIIELNINVKNPVEEELSINYINEYFTGEENPRYEAGQVLQLNNIYYDFDKYNIRADAAYELDYLVALMDQYPSLEIELHAHTDSRGKNQYNQWLSQFRANEARRYLLRKGIAKYRIHRAKGHGETRLYNHCADGEECTEAEHQQNRRTEVKIVRFEEGLSLRGGGEE